MTYGKPVKIKNEVIDELEIVSQETGISKAKLLYQGWELLKDKKGYDELLNKD